MQPSAIYATAVWIVLSISRLAIGLLLIAGMGHGGAGGSLFAAFLLTAIYSLMLSIAPACIAYTFFTAGSKFSKRSQSGREAILLGIIFGLLGLALIVWLSFPRGESGFINPAIYALVGLYSLLTSSFIGTRVR